MNLMRGFYALSFLSAVCLWSTAYCQDVDNLIFRLHGEEEMHSAMRNLQKNGKEAVQTVLSALENMKNLWTVHLIELLETYSSKIAYNLSEECHKSAIGILEYNRPSNSLNLTIPGARLIPLLDATGKLGAGLLTGNVILDGAFDECFSYNYTGYCVANSVSIRPEVINIPIAWTVGLCVPKGCNSADISFLINKTKVLQADQATITCLDSKYPLYNVGAKIMLIVTGIFILLVLVGTMLDIALLHRKVFAKEHTILNSDDDHTVLVSNAETDKDSDKKGEGMKHKRWKNSLKYIIAFSLFKTVPTLLATKQSSSVITSLNGLRVISMFWVILGHTHFWIFQRGVVNADNKFGVRELFSRLSFRVVDGALFAVDVFFLLSGVLVAYLTLREMKKRKGRFPFIKFYVHRYLRLTPTYAFVLFFTWFLTPHLAYGPGIMNNPFSKSCSMYWWTNLLYINNLYPWRLDDECINWTWYLANDMQFYIISPLILIAAYHFLPIGLIIGGLFLASGFIITATLTGIYDLQANMFSMLAYGYESKPGTSVTYLDDVYIKPWHRIAPYIVGLSLGYILYCGYRFHFNRIINAILYCLAWVIAAFVAFWIIYGLYFTWHGHVPTTAENVTYVTFSRFLWGLCFALLVFACHNGYGWFINSFLSMKIWTPLARMTFNAYLVHPVVLTIVYGQLQTTLHYTDITLACYAVAFVVLSYGVAAIICVLVELPLGTVEMLVFKLLSSISCNKKKEDMKTNYEEIKEPVKIL